MSLDSEDLRGVGRPSWYEKGPAKASVASATTPQFHWEVLSLSTETSRGENPPACFSVLGVAGSSPGWTTYPSLAKGPPK